jgi:hypothetical protein
MPYVRLQDGTPAELVPYERSMGAGFESVMHLPITVSPHCSIQGTSLGVIAAQSAGTHQSGLPEGVAPWQELPSQPKP